MKSRRRVLHRPPKKFPRIANLWPRDERDGGDALFLDFSKVDCTVLVEIEMEYEDEDEDEEGNDEIAFLDCEDWMRSDSLVSEERGGGRRKGRWLVGLMRGLGFVAGTLDLDRTVVQL